ncbi:MAG: hypothetical protein JXR37_01685 [Kiritimatiellae bacterium]|nr:hypothetical protein [Kiritimatiellia bacterium]
MRRSHMCLPIVIFAMGAGLAFTPASTPAATYYIDPTAGTSGDGSQARPWRSWELVEWHGGDTYLQRAGTTWRGPIINIGAGNVTLGKYGSGALPVLKLTTVGGNTPVINISNKRGCTIQDLRLESGTGEKAGTSGVKVGGSVGLLRILRCKFTFLKFGIRLQTVTADKVLVDGCEIWNFGEGPSGQGGDGIWAVCDNLEVCNTYIHDFDSSAEDGIQGANEVAGWHIHHNLIDHSDSNLKQEIIISGDAKDRPPLIEYNELIGRPTCVLLINTGGIVRYNRMVSGIRGVSITTRSPDCPPVEIYGNLFMGCAWGVTIGGDGDPETVDERVSVSILHNTFRGIGTGCVSATEPEVLGSPLEMKNNIFCPLPDATALRLNGRRFVSDYNCFWPEQNGLIKFGGAWYSTLAAYQSAIGQDRHSIAADPLFADTNGFRLEPDSPCIGRGVRIAEVDFDIEGMPFGDPPTLGACEAGAQGVRIQSREDDAEERLDTGAVTLGSSDLELGTEAVAQLVGLRFTSVPIPPGAVVTRAYVQFRVDETGAEPTSLLIQGEAADTPAAFAASTGNLSRRARTAAGVRWTPPAWNTAGEAGPAQRTPDLSAVLQQIVNRQGWASGNPLALLISGTGRRVAESCDGDAAGAAQLCAEYRPRAFRAYNDLAWANGQASRNITAYSRGQGGTLTDYACGMPVAATLAVGSGGAGPHMDQGADAAAGTDADGVFGGIVDGRGLLSYGSEPLTLTLGGLEPGLAYTVVLYGNRDNTSYTARRTRFTIGGAERFINASTPGSAYAGSGAASVTILNGYNTRNGYVARFRDIDPGADGEFVLTVADGGSASPPKFYLNALMLEAAPRQGSDLLIPRGAVWKYEDSGTDLRSAWRSLTYADADWAEGSAPLGYGDSVVTTETSYGPDSADKNITAYFRKHFFVLAPPSAGCRLTLHAKVDDGFVAYLNGAEVARGSMPAGPVVYETAAFSHEAETYETVDLSAHLGKLVAGENVLAVEVHQRSGTSSDMVFDGWLSVEESSVGEDADGDGMPDEWERQYFATTGSAGPDEDTDGDGLSNVQEYIAGTDPTDRRQTFAVDVRLAGGNTVLVSFAAPAAAGPGYAGLERHFALTSRAAIGSGGDWAGVSGYTDILGTGQTVVFTNRNPAAAATCYRGEVWLE